MNKEFIPRTNPDWGLELPDEHINSLVSKDGRSHDDGFNFDEKNDHYEEHLAPTPSFDPEAAKKAREEAAKNEDAA